MESAKKEYFLFIVEKVIASALTAIPFLNYPVVKQLFTKLVMVIAEKIYEQLRIAGINLSVEFKTEQQRKAYDVAMKDLGIVLSKPNKTKEEIENAKREYKKKLRDLIRLGTI